MVKGKAKKVAKKKNAAKATVKKATTRTKAEMGPGAGRSEEAGGDARGRNVGLTVRVEINLPADGDQETYDRIFKSIRENLIDAE